MLKCIEIRNPPFDKLVDTNSGQTIVENQRNVSGFLPTAGEETAFSSEHPLPPCSHQTNCGRIVKLVINHLKYILFELYCLCLRVYAFSLYLLKPFCTVEPALCKHVTSWRYNVRARQPDSNAGGFEQVASTRTSHAECTPPLATATCVCTLSTDGGNQLHSKSGKMLPFFGDAYVFTVSKPKLQRATLFLQDLKRSHLAA